MCHWASVNLPSFVCVCSRWVWSSTATLLVWRFLWDNTRVKQSWSRQYGASSTWEETHRQGGMPSSCTFIISNLHAGVMRVHHCCVFFLHTEYIYIHLVRTESEIWMSTRALWHFCSVTVRKTITVAGCWWTYHLAHMISHSILGVFIPSIAGCCLFFVRLLLFLNRFLLQTGRAIKFAVDHVFASSQRIVQAKNRIAVVVTDGKSQDDVVNVTVPCSGISVKR